MGKRKKELSITSYLLLKVKDEYDRYGLDLREQDLIEVAMFVGYKKREITKALKHIDFLSFVITIKQFGIISYQWCDSKSNLACVRHPKSGMIINPVISEIQPKLDKLRVLINKSISDKAKNLYRNRLEYILTIKAFLIDENTKKST